MAKFVNQCEAVLYIKEMGSCFVGYFNLPEKKFIEKHYPNE